MMLGLIEYLIFGLFVINLICILCPRSSKVYVWIGLGNALILFVILMALFNFSINTPTALDVYRGRTTLQVTFQDTQPIDTLVVFIKK